jgi:hypothetical protein
MLFPPGHKEPAHTLKLQICTFCCVIISSLALGAAAAECVYTATSGIHLSPENATKCASLLSNFLQAALKCTPQQLKGLIRGTASASNRGGISPFIFLFIQATDSLTR